MTYLDSVSSNRTRYMKEWSILTAAAVGVTVTRTREPFRVVEALREYGLIRSYDFKVWTRLRGWGTYPNTADENIEPEYDGENDFVDALMKINHPESGFPEKGIYSMMWPHWEINGDRSIPYAVQCIAEYARLFAEVRRRLVLIVPDHFEMPQELIDCVTIIDFDPPSQDEIKTQFNEFLEMAADNNMGQSYEDDDVNRIVAAAGGLTLMEAETAFSRALMENRDKDGDRDEIPVDEFLEVVGRVKTEAVKRTECLEVMAPAHMDEIGGLDALKEWVRARRTTFSKEARAAGVDKPKGVMLAGPPGTAKSMSAKAIAHELGLPLIKFDVGAVFNSLVGSSEARVRMALKMLDAMAPCVAFIDEVDKVFQANEGGNDSGVSRRIMGSVLTHLQESKANIFWVVTANRVDNLPPEMVRKGRLDEIFSVTTPDETERGEIFRIHLSKRQHDWASIEDQEAVIQASHGYVGAEIEAAVKEAVLKAYVADKDIVAADLVAELQSSKPLSQAFPEQFTAMQEWADNNARPSSTGRIRARTRKRMVKTQVTGKRKLSKGVMDG